MTDIYEPYIIYFNPEPSRFKSSEQPHHQHVQPHQQHQQHQQQPQVQQQQLHHLQSHHLQPQVQHQHQQQLHQPQSHHPPVQPHVQTTLFSPASSSVSRAHPTVLTAESKISENITEHCKELEEHCKTYGSHHNICKTKVCNFESVQTPVPEPSSSQPQQKALLPKSQTPSVSNVPQILPSAMDPEDSVSHSSDPTPSSHSPSPTPSISSPHPHSRELSSYQQSKVSHPLNYLLCIKELLIGKAKGSPNIKSVIEHIQKKIKRDTFDYETTHQDYVNKMYNYIIILELLIVVDPTIPVQLYEHTEEKEVTDKKTDKAITDVTNELYQIIQHLKSHKPEILKLSKPFKIYKYTLTKHNGKFKKLLLEYNRLVKYYCTPTDSVELIALDTNSKIIKTINILLFNMIRLVSLTKLTYTELNPNQESNFLDQV